MTPDELRKRNFLSVRETAVVLGDGDGPLDDRTVRRAIEAGQIPAVQIGTKTRVPAPQIADMIAPPRADESATVSLDPETVRAALDMVRAGIAALDALLGASDIGGGITDRESGRATPIRPGHSDDSAAVRGESGASFRGDVA